MINIVGDIFTTSGYSIHTRNLANALSKLTDARLQVNLIPGWEQDVTDKELQMIKQPETEDQINLIITLPPTWKLYTKKGRNWAYVIWEGDKVPKSWIEEFINPDIEYIFVASEHTKKAIMNTCNADIIFHHGWQSKEEERIKREKESIEKRYGNFLDKIKIIPHGVNLDLFYPKQTEKDKFTYFCNKGFRNLEDRGGIPFLIKAFYEEFTNEKVKLLIKLNPAYGIPNLNEMLEKLKPRKDNLPLIEFTSNAIPYDKLVDLYNQADVFVSPSRSDAFNIPCIEAMACGLPVITTSFGGQTDYCNESNGWIISGEMTNVTWDIQYEGIKWLTPSIKELRKAMRDAYTDQKILSDKGTKALETSKEFTWDASAKKIVELI